MGEGLQNELKIVEARKRNFPSAAEYKVTPEFSNRRQVLLQGIVDLEKLISLAQGEDAIDEAEFSRLKVSLRAFNEQLLDQAEKFDINDAYLDGFQEPSSLGGKKFTAEARNNPKVMLDWITRDVLMIITRLLRSGKDLRGADFSGKVGALDFYRNVLDDETLVQ